MKICVLIRIHRIHLKTDYLEIFSGDLTGLSDIFYIRFGFALSGKDQDVITVTFGNDKMGSLLIVKKDAVTGAPISDVEFLVTDSDGSVIGTANGKYVTDSAGTIRIDGLTPGMTVIAKEVRAKDGYILDDTPQSIKINATLS